MIRQAEKKPLQDFLNVYVAEIPLGLKQGKIYPKSRAQEIEACASEKVQREKYYVWKLLEYAFSDLFDVKFKKIAFEKSLNGKWRCDLCHFSLSHSKNAVAVAVSNRPVGVDIELFAPERMQGLEKRLLNEKELSAFAQTQKEKQNEFLLEIWTKKESIYKSLDVPNCSALCMDTTAAKTFTRSITIANTAYLLTVTFNGENTPQVREKINLT